MEFLAYSILGLIALFILSLGIVEAGYLVHTLYSRLYSWWRFGRPMRRSGRGVKRLTRVYRRGVAQSRLGTLRVTQSRARSLDEE